MGPRRTWRKIKKSLSGKIVTDQEINSNKCNTAELGWKRKRLPKHLAGLLMRSRSELLLNIHTLANGCTSLPKSPPAASLSSHPFTPSYGNYSLAYFSQHNRWPYSSLPPALPFSLNFQQCQKPFLCCRARYLATPGLG